jgi:viroplasmin and RNaseH domain-containing protein
MYIRYRYGYHQTKYGQLMLDQIGYTVEQFREEALVYLQQDIEDNWIEMISLSVMKVKSFSDKDSARKSNFLKSAIQIKDYTLVEDDRMIIYTNEMADTINKAFPDTTTSEEMSAGIVKYLEWAGNDTEEDERIEVIDGDVVIWGKFKVDF